MLIDFHTHAFPEKIAVRAVSSLAHGSGGMVPQTDGTLQSLKATIRSSRFISMAKLLTLHCCLGLVAMD